MKNFFAFFFAVALLAAIGSLAYIHFQSPQLSSNPSGSTQITPTIDTSQSHTLQMGTLTITPNDVETNCPPHTTQNTTISPLIFGTNIGSQFMKSAKTRELFKQIHVQFLRVGFLSPDDTSSLTPDETAMLETVRDMCITPLIILHLRVHGHDPTQVNQVIVTGVEKIFGDHPVYYEFHNEPDIVAMHADQYEYTADWNHVIAAVKPFAPHGKFGGPVVSQALPGYISYFYHNAKPRPDFISWHEYNCGNNDNPEKCISRVDNWTRNIGRIKDAIKGTGDPIPPFIISEWNYDSVAPDPDPRATPDFLHNYMQTAFEHLVQNGVFAAAQFKSTNFKKPYLLIDSNDNLTAEGTTFQSMYEQIFGK